MRWDGNLAPTPRHHEKGPASIIQEGLWVEETTRRAGSAYREGVLLHLNGPLDRSRLERAFHGLVQRHPALRTGFSPGPSGLEQQVFAPTEIRLEAVDFAKDGTVGWASQQLQADFELAAGPLYRVALARIGEQQHRLAVVAHHLVVDGWSLGVFQRDLSLLYQHDAANGLPALTQTPIGYARWQRAWVQSSEAERAATYWRRQLADLDVRASGPGGPVTTVKVEVQPALVVQLRETAKSLRVSPFAVLFAAFAAAMRLATGRDDLALATDFSGRIQPAFEPLIAMMVNQLPLRHAVRAGVSAGEEILASHRLTLDALSHANLPYPHIVSASGRAGQPLFEAKFVLHNMPLEPLLLDGLQVAVEPLTSSDPKFPALMELWEDGGALVGNAIVDAARSHLQAGALVSYFKQELVRLAGLQPLSGPVTGGKTLESFKPARRRVDPEVGAVEITPSPLPPFPCIVTSLDSDLDLGAWVDGARPEVVRHLHRAGAVLFRSFRIASAPRFQALVTRISGETLGYSERSTPRKRVEEGIYTSTEYPADQEIFFHNENAYAANWPGLIFFWCEIPPKAGGRTPLADCRAVLSALPDEIRAAFQQHGVHYRRLFRPGLGLSWQEAFGCTDIETLRDRYTAQGYRFDLDLDGEGALRADFVCPATTDHPDTGARSWFNHAALFHAAALPDLVRQAGDTADYSAIQVRLGNGAAIPDDWIMRIRQAYRDASSAFDWQGDDVLMVDNRLSAHGREPFTPPRRILVAMANPQRHVARS